MNKKIFVRSQGSPPQQTGEAAVTPEWDERQQWCQRCQQCQRLCPSDPGGPEVTMITMTAHDQPSYIRSLESVPTLETNVVQDAPAQCGDTAAAGIAISVSNSNQNLSEPGLSWRRLTNRLLITTMFQVPAQVSTPVTVTPLLTNKQR